MFFLTYLWQVAAGYSRPMGTLWTEVQLLKPDQNLAPNVHAARSVIARMIADGGLVSRREIVRTTGLARSTIDGHIDVLMDAGLVEGGGLGGTQTRGRPAQVFRISARRGVVLVADVTVSGSRLAVTTLDKRVLARTAVDVSVGAGPDAVLRAIGEAFDAMLHEHDLRREDSLALSVGLPGPVDSHLGYAVRPPHMPGWDGFSVCRYMAEGFGCDVVVDNDVNLMALGEARAYQGEFLPLLMVHVGAGVGGGFVSEDGLLLHGADGAAADIGHIRAPELGDELCSCGNRGCLEAVGSAGAIARKVSALRKSPVAPEDVVDLICRADPAAVNVLRESAAQVGRVIADLVNFCNPARIVLGGALTECTEDFLAQVRSVVYQQAQPLATRNLSIVHSSLGEEAALVGGMVSAIEQVLSPRGIQYHTRPKDSDMRPLGL